MMLRGDWSPYGWRKEDLCPSTAGRVWQYLFMILVFAGQSCNVNIKKLAGSMGTPDHDRTWGFFDHVNCLHYKVGCAKWVWAVCTHDRTSCHGVVVKWNSLWTCGSLWFEICARGRRSSLLKTGFFRQVRELKIQRKNPGSALWLWRGLYCWGIIFFFFSLVFVIWSWGTCQIPSLYHGKKWKKSADVSKSIMWHYLFFPLFLVILGGYLSDTLCVSWKKV